MKYFIKKRELVRLPFLSRLPLPLFLQSLFLIFFLIFGLPAKPIFGGSLNENFLTEDTIRGFGDPAATKLWRRATWMQNHTKMSHEGAKFENGFLKIRVSEESEDGEIVRKGGSIQTLKEDYSFGKWEARLKPSSVPGVLNSMFTMDYNGGDGVGADGTKQEVDIEFLTRTFSGNTGEIHLAVHASDYSNYYHQDIELGFNPSDDFHVYGIEILEDRVNWYVDGLLLDTYYYDSTVSVDAPYMFMMNGWTYTKWVQGATGPPSEEADYLVDWVRYTPFQADKRHSLLFYLPAFIHEPN